MKKLAVLMAGLALAVVVAPPNGAKGQPFPWVTDTAEFEQIKIAQVPLPWQFWAVADSTVIDKIRISPTWLNPPDGLPRGQGPILVRRQVARSTQVIPLEDLVWDDESGPVPSDNLRWAMVDKSPMEVMEGRDLELEIPVDMETRAVLVAYEVIMPMENDLEEVVGHFINEAVLMHESPAQIVQVMVNLDIHNGTGTDVTDFELDFAGLTFSKEDVLWALGFIKSTGEAWGANERNPLVVRPIKVGTQDGTEVKWVQPDRPLKTSEWLHVGLVFELDGLVGGVNATVQGYWTQVLPKARCQETVNPHGKTVPPAGSSTLPGAKGGINEEGFYRLSATGAAGALTVYVVDTGSSTVFGPFMNGDRVKYTEARGAVPNQKKIGSTAPGNKGQSDAVAYHITGKGDMGVYAVDYLGNRGPLQICPVPPPPK